MPMSEPLLAGARLEGRGGHEVGRELLAGLYFRKTGQALPKIAVTDRGKPYFEASPLHFSITHTDSHAFCALSESPVGIDAEEMDRRISPRLAEKILSPAEKARYDAAPDRRAALLRLWVLKEAAAKLTGEGLRGYPNHTDFSPDDPRIREIDGCYVALLEG
ncbi:MAG: 4'-phosphopantetheinyl transferase superfamily protein [Oscillospiraceae bacterium]|nr:4'-phosphopantetheinyl transferase superfamily protein [Oscillospiraceae bacterium]